MTGKQLANQLGWATAVGAAFFIGAQTRSHDPERATTAGNPGDERSIPGRSTGGMGEAVSRGVPRVGRQGEGSGEGALARLFGIHSPGGAALEAIATQAVKDPNPVTRRLAFSKLLESMTVENALEIRGQLVALGAEGGMWNDFNYAWGALAGREAFEFARTSEEQDLGAALTGWAAADPAGALAALDQLPSELEGQRRSLEGNLISGLADRDLGLATEVALRLGADDAGHAGRLLRSVADEALRSGGPAGASQWIETLPDGQPKGEAMRRVTETYVRRDPEAAADWAGRFADQDYAQSAIGEIGGEWAERDPQATVAWLESLPAGNPQNAGFSQALGEWEDRDPEAAGNYLMAMDRSPQRDAAVAGFATGYAWQDPTTAIAWAQDISDPRLRESSLTRVGQAYFRRDPEGARIWLESSGLPPAAQEQVIQPRGRWRR